MEVICLTIKAEILETSLMTERKHPKRGIRVAKKAAVILPTIAKKHPKPERKVVKAVMAVAANHSVT